MKTIATSAVLLAGFAAAQTSNLVMFAPAIESQIRPECRPTQCTNLLATDSATELIKCLQSAAVGCEYVGFMISTGTSADVCTQTDGANTYVTVTLPSSELNTLPITYGPVNGTLTLNADAPASANCSFYAYQDSSTGCQAPLTAPILGNIAISDMPIQSQALRIDMLNLTNTPVTDKIGFSVALPAAQCGTNFSSAVFDSVLVPFAAKVPDASSQSTDTGSETYTMFVQAAGSATSCYTPECTFTLFPITREQVDACVSSVPADCVFEGVSRLVTENANPPCDGVLASSDEQNIVIDQASYRRLGRGTGNMSGTLTLSMKTAAAIDCPLTSYKVENFDINNNCGIVEPVSPSNTPIATLAADSNSITIDAATVPIDASLGLKISGPAASCGTASNSLATDVSAPFVYSREIDGPTSTDTSGVEALTALGSMVLVTMLVAA